MEVVLLEGGDEQECNPKTIEGSLWWGNFCYSHNYRFYAEKAGFITLESRIIRPFSPYEDFPAFRKGTINYFYHAKTAGV